MRNSSGDAGAPAVVATPSPTAARVTPPAARPAAWGARAHRFAPARREGFEHLDDPALSPALRRRSVRDIVCANVLFGGTRAALLELDRVIAETRASTLTLLDVGTGAGDIPYCLRARAARRGVTLHTFGLDWSEVLAHGARSDELPTACGSAMALPIRDHSVDAVLCSQLLHHFDHAGAVAALREMHRVARHRVIVCDLRRSRAAVAGIWLASFPLRFHTITRHDAVASVRRGFTRGEIASLLALAGGTRVSARERLGFRVTALSAPANGSGGAPERARAAATDSAAPDAAPVALGPMPTDRRMQTVDERLVRATPNAIFELARSVERWPEWLPHYRLVRMHTHAADGGGVVEMAAWRDFGPVRWPTWWMSDMEVDHARPAVRYRHVRGITRGMDVEWRFDALPGGGGTRVRIVHVWNGPSWPLIGGIAAIRVIGPQFIHAIASRTLAGLAAMAERG